MKQMYEIFVFKGLIDWIHSFLQCYYHSLWQLSITWLF